MRGTTGSEGDRRARVARILDRLAEVYPDAECALEFESPFQLLIATILAAQCTDARVNEVTARLFVKYPGPAELAAADLAALEEDVRPTGFFRNKARAIQGASAALVDRFGGQVPETLDELVALPGVARKTANLVLGTALGRATGIVVDTHVKRLAGRLGLSGQSDPVKIERDLVEIVPADRWVDFAYQMIDHGRAICDARKPRCDECPLRDDCPYP